MVASKAKHHLKKGIQMASRIRGWISGLVLGALLMPLSASSQGLVEKQTFEGVLTYELKDFQSLQQMTVYVKNGRLRIMASNQEMGNAIVQDYGLKKGFTIISGREQYIEWTIVAPAKTTAESEAAVEPQRTETIEDILDYQCEQFLYTWDEGEIEVWATKGLGTGGTFLLPQLLGWQWKIIELGYFPLRVIERNSSGNETSRFEVVSVEEKPLADSWFRIPKGYEKVGPEALEPQKPVTKKKRSR